jgi:bifunctional DNA-binding transcriptional regulator/antitoxin component of YhaV-PrlF toxin-antitoxin module
MTRTSTGYHGYLAVQGRGTVALPAVLRKRYHLDRPGAQVEITERADGVLELRPALPVPATEQWFWEERWQAGEREVDRHVAADEVLTSASADDLLDDLDALDRA